jgi:hypothetical protein
VFILGRHLVVHEQSEPDSRASNVLPFGGSWTNLAGWLNGENDRCDHTQLMSLTESRRGLDGVS